MNWIERYSTLATATHKPHILLHDRDNLLAITPLRAGFEQLGFSLWTAETAWQVRVRYEQYARGRSERILLIVPAHYQPLPDMVADTYWVEVGLRELFPQLDASVLSGLSAQALDCISAVSHYQRLEKEATLKWLIEHLYNIDVDSLRVNPTEERVRQAVEKLINHPADTNPAIETYISAIAAPYLVRFDKLLRLLEDRTNNPIQILDEWLGLLPLLAQATDWTFTWPFPARQLRLNKCVETLNYQFQTFLDLNYKASFTLSSVKRPAVVSQVLDHLQRRAFPKIALIVIDGMNGWQGKMLTDALQNHGLKPEFGATLAFIPTITAWSRQALFKGKHPDLTTDNRKEGKLFEHYWQTTGLQPHQISYAAFSAGTPFDVGELPDSVLRLGLVSNDLDNLMHGTVLGNRQLRQATRQWIAEGPILSLISQLTERGFTCCITADHGNIEASGHRNLKLTEKVGNLSRSKRHIQFDNAVLQQAFLDQNSDMATGKQGLSVYLRDLSAFTTQHQSVVTHGGSHLWEVLVPFILV